MYCTLHGIWKKPKKKYYKSFHDFRPEPLQVAKEHQILRFFRKPSSGLMILFYSLYLFFGVEARFLKEQQDLKPLGNEKGFEGEAPEKFWNIVFMAFFTVHALDVVHTNPNSHIFTVILVIFDRSQNKFHSIPYAKWQRFQSLRSNCKIGHWVKFSIYRRCSISTFAESHYSHTVPDSDLLRT